MVNGTTRTASHPYDFSDEQGWTDHSTTWFPALLLQIYDTLQCFRGTEEAQHLFPTFRLLLSERQSRRECESVVHSGKDPSCFGE